MIDLLHFLMVASLVVLKAIFRGEINRTDLVALKAKNECDTARLQALSLIT